MQSLRNEFCDLAHCQRNLGGWAVLFNMTGSSRLRIAKPRALGFRKALEERVSIGEGLGRPRAPPTTYGREGASIINYSWNVHVTRSQASIH